MGEQWTRLTPEGDDSGVTRYRKGRIRHCHVLQAEGNYPIQLSGAELLALAQASGVYRQVPEVQALAEDLREATLICQGQLALNRHIGNVTVTEEWEQRIGRYMLHLAPFEEVPDATE